MLATVKRGTLVFAAGTCAVVLSGCGSGPSQAAAATPFSASPTVSAVPAHDSSTAAASPDSYSQSPAARTPVQVPQPAPLDQASMVLVPPVPGGQQGTTTGDQQVFWPDGSVAANVPLEVQPIGAPDVYSNYDIHPDLTAQSDAYGRIRVLGCPCIGFRLIYNGPTPGDAYTHCSIEFTAVGATRHGIQLLPGAAIKWLMDNHACSSTPYDPEAPAYVEPGAPSWQSSRQMLGH